MVSTYFQRLEPAVSCHSISHKGYIITTSEMSSHDACAVPCCAVLCCPAETFCLNCGILALDEPTTNLDAGKGVMSPLHPLGKRLGVWLQGLMSSTMPNCWAA